MENISELESLFLSTLADLEERVDSNDPYKILIISSLIRKLLIDGYPLVDQINKTHKLKIRYRIGVFLDFPLGIPEPSFLSIQDAFDPNANVPGTSYRTVTKDGLLSATVLVINGKKFSVKEFIKYEANVKGGVHSGSPRSDRERALEELDSLFRIGGYRASLRQLKAIAGVILTGLSELRNVIEKSKTN